MPKLPTRESLGALPSTQRAKRTLTSISMPGASAGAAIGGGIEQLGRGFGVAAHASDLIEDYSRKREAFETERSFQEFEWNRKIGLDQSMRTLEPGQAGDFAERETQSFTESAKEFYKNVPEHLKPVYENKLFKVERDIYGGATTFAREKQKQFSTNSIEDARENIYRPRARNTPTDELDQVTADYERLVRANPDLTPIEQDDLIRKGRRAIGLSHIDGLPVKQSIELLDARTRPADITTEGLLRKFEGFRENAYWDKNAFRVGYGSDTVTRADGTIVPVTKDTKITREDAERDLARRSGEFSSVVEKQVGGETWAQMPANVRSALTSVAYNYGKLPDSVVNAVNRGDTQEIAEAVRALPANRKRRSQEADVILGASGHPAALSALTDDDWERAERGLHSKILDLERVDKAAERERKRQSEIAEDEIRKDLISDLPKTKVQDIVSNNQLTREAQDRLLAFGNRVNKPDPLAKVSQKTTMELIDGMRRGEVTSIDPIVDAYTRIDPETGTGKMTRADFEFALKHFREGTTADGSNLLKLKAKFVSQANEAIGLANLGTAMTGGAGTFARYEFERYVDKRIDDYRATKKDPSALFDPLSPDYLGKPDASGRPAILKPFVMTMQQKAAEDAAAAKVSVKAALSTDEMKRLDDWLHARGNPAPQRNLQFVPEVPLSR